MRDDGETPRDTAKAEAEHAAMMAAKRLEKWPLLKAAVPLIAAGLGAAVLYGYFAVLADRAAFWVGPPLMLAGSVLAAAGLRRRLAVIASQEAPHTGGYWWLFAGWALVVAGLLVPPYLQA